MPQVKGWFIKSRPPNDIFWSLRPDIADGWTTDLEMALLFARKVDAESYFENHFHPSTKAEYQVMGIN